MAKERYDHRRIEADAQARWEKEHLYEVDLATAKDPYYLLTEFPYPSGDLHVGHWYAFAVTDIFARFKRMQGKDVLFPIGFDAFGLPAENAAIKRNLDPKEWTYGNMETMRTQLRSMGASLDWSKSLASCDPAYYHWTQWLFLKLYEHGLAERRNAPVKWCPFDKTVLANEQVIAGACERCGTLVEEKILTQWFLKITDYAKRLLEDLEPLPWREETKDAQRAWIGESEGAILPFQIIFGNEEQDADGNPAHVQVFTTRPDTVFGATYVVLAPEHPWVTSALTQENVLENAADVQAYIDTTKRKSERERMENKEKTGIELKGVRAINPATATEIPVFIADYVLASYGTGAVMAVPAHDERDFEFAKALSLPIKHVVAPQLVDHSNPHQPGKELLPRTITLSVVYDPATKRYLTLNWKKEGWVTFVTGGVDDGETDLIESARREILEETGFNDVRFVRHFGETEASFYAAHKGVNRVTSTSLLLFELVSDTREDVAAEEAAQHEPVWVTEEELQKLPLQHAELPLILERLRTGIDVYEGEGVLRDSGKWTGRKSDEARFEIAEAVGGTRTTTYRLRDWLVSRQRYWGCPIPIVYDPDGKAHSVPSEHLPWLLPEDVDFSLTDGSPLATSKELKERVERLFGAGWTPEYDTLDTFVDSSWYFLRYLAPTRPDAFSDTALMQKWLPVDRYSGGSEHTTMHLLYARFFHKALYDLALVPTPEPFAERFNRGLILGPDGQKMSKSKGNVINPDEYVQKYGADAVRTYLAFIGPYNEPGSYPWKPEGVESTRRFLDRVVSLSKKIGDVADSSSQHRAAAIAALKVGESIERFKLNTGVAALMILVNELEAAPAVDHEAYAALVRLLAPFAPHLAEHLHSELHGIEVPSVHIEPWPAFPDIDLAADLVTIGVQVAGKRRGEIEIAPDTAEEAAVESALAIPEVQKALGGAQPGRIVYVPGKILNLIP